MNVNVFKTLKISCFATKKEIEDSFLKTCGDLDETEEKIKDTIKRLNESKYGSDIEPAFIRRNRAVRIQELEQMEKAFRDLGVQYEDIMNSNIDQRFDYIMENMDLYEIAGINHYDTVEDITGKIEKRISECFFRKQESDNNARAGEEGSTLKEAQGNNQIENASNVEEPDVVGDKTTIFPEDESRENATKNEIEILRRIEELMRDPEKKRKYDRKLLEREAANAREEEEAAKKIVTFKRKIYFLDDSGIDKGLDALFGKPGSRVNQEEIHRMQERNRRISRTAERMRREDMLEEERRIEAEREAQQKRKIRIRGVKRVVAMVVSGAILAAGIQIGKDAKENINIFPIAKPTVTTQITPDFEPAVTPMVTPESTVEPTPQLVKYTTLSECYKGLPEGSKERVAIEKAVREVTGVNDGSNVESFLDIIDMNLEAGTDTITVGNFMQKLGLYIQKASIAEATKMQEGDITIDDVRIIQSNKYKYTSVCIKGQEKYKADWNMHSGVVEPFANETLSRTFLNDFNLIVNLQNAINESRYDEIPGFSKAVYAKVLSICSDRTNGIETYGIENGKLGVKIKEIDNSQTGNTDMRSILDDEGR